MRRSVIAMLLVVAMVFTMHYAATEDIDLSTMSTRELQNLRQRINAELKDRPPEREPEAETQRRERISKQYDAWADVYDFDSIIADIESGQHGLTDKCAEEVKIKAGFAQTILKDCRNETDPFTGQRRIEHATIKSFGDGCQVFPYIDESGFNMIVGFPYKDSFHYDQIFLKRGDDIREYDKYDKKEGFDTQFETLNGESWEYSILSGVTIGDQSLETISFREDGSLRKENYILTENETHAVDAIYALYRIKHDIHSRISHWNSLGD